MSHRKHDVAVEVVFHRLGIHCQGHLLQHCIDSAIHHEIETIDIESETSVDFAVAVGAVVGLMQACIESRLFVAIGGVEPVDVDTFERHQFRQRERLRGGVDFVGGRENVEVRDPVGVGVESCQGVVKVQFGNDDIAVFQVFSEVDTHSQVVDTSHGIRRCPLHRVDDADPFDIEAHIGESADKGKVDMVELAFAEYILVGQFVDNGG